MADFRIGNPAGPELSDVIGKLRQDLMKAMEEGRDERIRFELGPVEVTLSVAVTTEGIGKAGVRFWVVDAGVEGKLGRARGQEIKLTLNPKDAYAPARMDGARPAPTIDSEAAPGEASAVPPRAG